MAKKPEANRDIEEEMAALRTIVDALMPLDEKARERIIRYCLDRMNHPPPEIAPLPKPKEAP